MSALLDGARVALVPIKLCALAACASALALLVYAIAADRALLTRAQRALVQRRSALAEQMLRAGLRGNPLALLVGQALVLCTGVSLALATREPLFLVLVPGALFAPRAWLLHAAEARVARIEQKLDVFGVLLANALRASPSIGRALGQIVDNVPAPLDAEVAQLLRELHVGSTLEQALVNLSVRVGSFQLDTMLSGLLIGRRIGGNVPEVLDTAADTIREMHRLEGVLSAKTAEGRVQAWMLGAMPVCVVFMFDAVKPGYFDVLTQSSLGLGVSMAAIGMWLCSIVAARRILEVQL